MGPPFLEYGLSTIDVAIDGGITQASLSRAPRRHSTRVLPLGAAIVERLEVVGARGASDARQIWRIGMRKRRQVTLNEKAADHMMLALWGKYVKKVPCASGI